MNTRNTVIGVIVAIILLVIIGYVFAHKAQSVAFFHRLRARRRRK